MNTLALWLVITPTEIALMIRAAADAGEDFTIPAGVPGAIGLMRAARELLRSGGYVAAGIAGEGITNAFEARKKLEAARRAALRRLAA